MRSVCRARTSCGPPETRNQKFRRLAQSRTNRILTGFPPLAKLAGPAYESTPEERRQIVDMLQKYVDDLKRVFFKEEPRKPSFSFD